jgi:class 3 adenylate cyclase
MSDAQRGPVHAREPWVLALAVSASRLAGFLSDGAGLFEHAQGPWPPAADAALPAPLSARLAGGGAAGLRLQLDAALDLWPWEVEIERACGGLAVARFLSRAPAGSAAAPSDARLGSGSADDPDWLHAPWAGCSAAAWQAQALGRALVGVSDEVPAWQARAFRLALQGRWAPGTRLAAAALAAALDSGLPRPQWRVYGDAQHTPAVISGVEQRRQVTSVSIDLFKSTDLLRHWGAERYAEAHADFHRRCRRIVEAHGGRLDDPQGDDGLMAYFGLGLAHADTASQAVRAAWMLAKSVAELGFTTRQGVATGRVAVSEAQPFGMEVYLAARLQRIAPAHGIVVAASTQRLLGPDVVCEPLPLAADLPGFDQPQAAWRVVQVQSPPAGVPRRWEQGRFVGRAPELELLGQAWARARREASVQYRCLVGDAGIGKSRLLHEFETRLRAAEPALSLVRVAGHAETRTSAFAALALALPGPALPLLSDLARRSAQPQDGSAASERQRERAALIDALLAEFLALARRTPLCCVFDDAEWLDPSTIELVERLRLQPAGVPLLIVVTLREAARGRERGLHTEPATTLRGLLPAESLDLIDALPLATPLSAELQQRIADRTGGVPLFLEETVRMVERQGGDPQALVQGIPDSLEDLLAARLDALGPALPLAQLAAVLGAEFAAPLWQAVLDEPEAWIQRAHASGAMQRLLDSGLLGPPEPGRARYRFRHALMRDAAYESLWERDRKRLHACVARVLERGPQQALGGLEMRAHHLAAADALPEAVAVLAQAARQAAEAAADREALALARRALELLSRLPDTPVHRQQALQLHLLQAARHVALDGYGAASVESAYLRAAALCSVTQDRTLRTRIDLGLEACYAMRGDLARARALAEAAIRQTPWDANLRLALQARWAWINVVFHQGELALALQMADECLARYHPGLHLASAVQDPGVMCLCYSAWGLFERGSAAQARQRVQRLLALAETLKHPFSTAVAHGFAASVALFCGEHAQGLHHAETSVGLCAAGAFQAWLAHAQVIRGRLRAALGEPLAGLADMEAGYALWVGTGARITCATYLAMQAEVCLQMGDPHEALRRLVQAREIAQRHGERYHEAELLRLHGCALWQVRATAADGDAAQALLAQALAMARAQGKLGFALRSATALAAAWRAEGANAKAQALLREALAAVPEHEDTQDSRAARAALAD